MTDCLRAATLTTNLLIKLPCAVLLAIAVTGAGSAYGVTFTDVTGDLGIQSIGPTAASAWGDANSDGWPDLWVSNHHGRPPNLFLNNGGKSFSDIAPKLDIAMNFEAGGWPDFHGAAWADYDNDGDQDLLVLTGAGAGKGTSKNYLFENIDTRFIDRAGELGLDYPKGRGRTPLWFDSNNDGRLDVLIMNKPREGAPSRLFRATPEGHFQTVTEYEAPTAWWFDIWSELTNLFSKGSESLSAATEFAILQPTMGGISVVTFGEEVKVRTLESRSYQYSTLASSVSLRNIQDAVLGDFDSDGTMDWFLLRSRPFVRDVVQNDSNQLQAVLNGSDERATGLEIFSAGDLKISLHRPWMDPSDPRINDPINMAIGNRTRTGNAEPLILTPSEARSDHPELSSLKKNQVTITWSDERESWQIANTTGTLNLSVVTIEPIEDWQPLGFNPSTGSAVSQLLLGNSESGQLTPHESSLPEAPCQSVAAADFDNDADLDLYLVCTNPTNDAPDLFLENDGTGTFTPHAQPAIKGRGNQVSAADFNRDGLVDIAVTNGAGAPPFANSGSLQLLRNNGIKTSNHNWLSLRLQGLASNREGIGAVVKLSAQNQSQIRIQGGGTHSLSQDSKDIHFGLASAKTVNLEIRWPSGQFQQLQNVHSNQILVVQEPSEQ